ncbi:PepSY-associated TM helix domain-containing protein [Parasedimentitalea huanghaiensis]|uniref:PepSY domain-containing protein n=1 Tax=Parasedimentitalea huanghaiensis TaxID=2682100 RepID=A0A6L6WK39_9RHOB|nr:PepSY domain-containing protein [Zongyanglinia huanghaiensis]MVO18176.1 PepSY domain-containing protein [Zongyanglinia huanghaiensis]
MATDSQTTGPARSLSEKFYFTVWRWHFYAGLYVIPFLIMLAVTGLVMMYIAVFSGRDGEHISVTPTGVALSLEQQSQAALSALPDATLVEWIGTAQADRASVFRVKSEGTQHLVAVNPYDATVIDSWVRQAGWYDFANDIHGTLLIGDTGDRLIEIAAGLGIVLVLTGLYLWWPRTTGLRTVLVPDLAARGRALWKSLHAVTGFYISVVLVLFLLSGLSWTGIWGEKLVQAWSSFPAEKWENVPLSDDTHANMNHGAIKDVPWALEQTLMPESGSDAGIEGLPADVPATVDSIAMLGRALGYEGRFRINFPSGETGVWTLSQDSMSNDSDCPTCDRTVHIDQHTGKILADVGFADYSLMGKSMAVGIALHEGDMGLWNLILNTVFCLSVIFVSVSGVVMWIKRRPSGAGRLAAPPAPADLPLWKGAALICVVTSLAFPLVGLTLLAVLAFEVLILGTIPAVKRALS